MHESGLDSKVTGVGAFSLSSFPSFRRVEILRGRHSDGLLVSIQISIRCPPNKYWDLFGWQTKPSTLYFRWTPHPVIVTIRDVRDYIRVLLYLIIPLLQVGGSS